MKKKKNICKKKNHSLFLIVGRNDRVSATTLRHRRGCGGDGDGSVGGAFVEKRLSTKKRVIESIINCTTPQRSM